MPQISSKKVIGGIIQFLIAIPVVLYISFALLSLLIFVFFIIPVVIPIATKMWYLDYVRSTLREVSRSPFYVSLVSTAFSVGALLVLGCLIGRRKVKAQFDSALDGDGINLIAGCLFVPYPKKMRVRENYYHMYYKHRGILILPEPENQWRGFTIITALSVIVFASMVIKDYLILKAASRYIPPLVNALGDLLLLWSALLIGILLGKGIMKREISCKWGKTSSGTLNKASIISDYLCCSPLLGSGTYIVIYHLVDLDEISFDEAEKVYLKFKSMLDNKMDLREWSKIE